MLKSILSLVIVLFLFVSCSEDFISVEEPIETESNLSDGKLAKMVWLTSPTHTWVNNDYDYFSFNGYDFSFNYTFTVNNIEGLHTNEVEILVNGQYCTTYTWTNINVIEIRWLDWLSFTYNNVQMQVRFLIYAHHWYEHPVVIISQPITSQVKMQGFATEIPLLSVTPSYSHSDYNAKPILTWGSNDPDVTSYQIDRKGFRLTNGQVFQTSYVIITSSANPGTITDTKIWWGVGRHNCIGYLYRLTATYGNNGGAKSYRYVYSYLADYDNYMP